MVSLSVQNPNSGIKDLRDISWEAIATSIHTLKGTGEASEENIAAVIHGTVDGIKQAESQLLDKHLKEMGFDEVHKTENFSNKTDDQQKK